jgi:hypothetical protein
MASGCSVGVFSKGSGMFLWWPCKTNAGNGRGWVLKAQSRTDLLETLLDAHFQKKILYAYWLYFLFFFVLVSIPVNVQMVLMMKPCYVVYDACALRIVSILFVCEGHAV